MSTTPDVDRYDPDFSIVSGGPYSRVLLQLQLTHPVSNIASKKCAVLVAVGTWLPLVALSALEGLVVQGATIPFIQDLSVHVRFLIAAPILILAEYPVHFRIRAAVRHFLVARLVRAEDLDRYVQAIDSAVRFRDARAADFALIVIVAISTWFMIQEGMGRGVGTWYEPHGRLSLAGWWYALVCMPLFQLLTLRWLYRLLVWAMFLSDVAKLDLLLTPTHPDGAGGLAFLGRTSQWFGPILFATSAVLSSLVASRVLFGSSVLYDLLLPYAMLMGIAMLVPLAPLLLFTRKLYLLKDLGLREYGALAALYTQQFQKKWIAGVATEEPLLGSADIQSLADLGNSFQVVTKMRVFPAGLNDLAMLTVPAIVPALPLAATVMPIADIAKELARFL